MFSLTMGRWSDNAARRGQGILQGRSRYASPTKINGAPLRCYRAVVRDFSPTFQRQTISSQTRYASTSKSLPMGNRNSSTAAAATAKDPASLTKLFDDAEANFPPRFREHGWYLTVIASFIGTGQQKLSGALYQHLVAQPQYQTSAARQALVRRLREALVKCIIINGIPVVIEAITSINEVEKPEDKDFSSSREDWQIGAATTERASKVLKVLYKSEKGGHAATLDAHRDIPWISKNVSYGLFLSDHRILSMQETELVVLPAIMTQNLYGPTYWHLRACLRVGFEPDEVEAVHKVIESVAAYGGKKLEVQRVKDVTDA